MNAGSKQFHDYCDQRIAAGEIELDRSNRQNASHNYYTLRNAAIQQYGLSPNAIVGADLLAAVFMKVKTNLIFIQPKAEPTKEEIRNERCRQLEADHNVGPLSARKDPRRTDDPLGGSTLKDFIKKAIDNLAKQSRGEVPPSREKPKQFRTIPPDVTPEQLRDGDYSVAEIKDYLARRDKTPKSKQ